MSLGAVADFAELGRDRDRVGRFARGVGIQCVAHRA